MDKKCADDISTLTLFQLGFWLNFLFLFREKWPGFALANKLIPLSKNHGAREQSKYSPAGMDWGRQLKFKLNKRFFHVIARFISADDL